MVPGKSLLLVALIAISACPAADARPPAEQPEAQTGWLRSHSRPVALEDEGFSDLEFLRPLLEGKRVVQLGENTHGVREYSLAKARIVRFLHEELGYDVIAFESALYQCYDADRTAATAPPRTTLFKCAFGVWHSEEVLPLFEYLRKTRQGERPLGLAGIDIQPIGRNKEGRPQFLSKIVAALDTDYAAEILTLDSTFLEVYAREGRERRAYYRSEDGQRMAAAYDSLASFLSGYELPNSAEPGRPDAIAAAVARQTARSMARYIRQQASPSTQLYVERRDEGMAANLAFILDELYPGRKVIVWGHNFHVRHDNIAIPPQASVFPDVAARTMGSWVRERYGDAVYTIGLYAYQGRAANNGGEIFDIEPAEPGSLEALLHGAAAHPALFVDLSRAGPGPGTAWMHEPITARYDATTPLSLIPRDQYDAILLIAEATPRVMLY